MLLSQSDVWEVPISCGYMLTMLALGAVWCALHEPERRYRWLVAASVAYGLAVGARPSLLFGAVILLTPVAQARREGRQMGAPVLAATIPILLIGLGLMLYNALRFGNPFEFGWHYQLHAEVPHGHGATLQSSLSLVQFPGVFSGAGALDGSHSFRAGNRHATPTSGLRWGRGYPSAS